MVERLIHYVMTQMGRTWRIGGKDTMPGEDDIAQTLDRAAVLLLDSPTGARLEIGGLLIEKRPLTHHVYIYVGDYQ